MQTKIFKIFTVLIICTFFLSNHFAYAVTYTITATSGPNGRINPSGVITVNGGAYLDFVINADIGFVIEKFIVDETNIAEAVNETNYNYYLEDISANHIIKVSFKTATSPILSADPNYISLNHLAGTTTINIANLGIGTLNWTASVDEYAASWISITGATSGTNAGTITCAYQANTEDEEREAYITITSSEASNSPIDIYIEQSAHGFIIIATAGENGEITPSGDVSVAQSEDQDFTITANTGYIIDELKVDETQIISEASGQYTFVYNFNAVSANHSISASFKLATTPILSVTPETQEVTNASGETTFEVSNIGVGNMGWTATTSASWITITSGASGTEP